MSSGSSEIAPDKNTKGCPCDYSTRPIRYFTGEIRLPETDVWADGYGLGWGHKRTYGNKMPQSWDRGNGWNWFVENWPYLINSGGSIAVLGDVNDIPWFSPDGFGGYTALFGRLEVLTYDGVNGEFNLLKPDGTVITFNNFSHATRPGLFKKITSAGGISTEVSANAEGDIVEVQRQVTIGSTTTTESFLYSFTSDFHLLNVVHRRDVNNLGWSNIRRAEYTYYGDSEDYGSLNDLRTVTRQTWNGSSWSSIGTSYYRYYKAGAANGFVHGLKLALDAAAFDKLAAFVPDPYTATDAEVAQFADYYFEYDGSQRVTREIVAAGSQTFTFSYTDSAFANGFNNWRRKTVETRPDGSQTIVYCNSSGGTMLRILQSGSSKWYTFNKFDSVGRIILTAESSAVTGYDDTKADLLNYDAVTGKYQYLSDTSGLISVFDFYTSTGSGGAAGYLQYKKIKQGQTGTEIKLQQLQYTSHSNGAFTVYPISKEISYPDVSNQAITIETSYSYVFHANSNQVSQKTTTWPAISGSQNGSGTANSKVEVFDVYGNLTWVKDERGFITAIRYSIPTGAVSQRIDDVDTAQVSDEPAGWTTPSGGGMQLGTDFEFDGLGRHTQELGPPHTLDLSGSATTARQATWTVYDDVNDQIRVGEGYATGTGPSYTYTLINPVAIKFQDRNGLTLQEILATRSSTTGRLVPGDTFQQTSYVRWKTYQYSDCCKLISSRIYFSIPSSGSGSSGTNYNQTDYGYDVMDRRNRVKTPSGTITIAVHDPRGLPTSTWMGTDDTGATASNPAGSGAPNNMVQITGYQYDGGSAGGDGNLTDETQYVDGSTTRATHFDSDWRNRRVNTDGEVDFYEKRYYDNLDRLTKVERYDTSASGNLIARSETKYDDLSRVYQTIQYAVDPATGNVGNALTDNTWYDPAGNVLKQLPAGSKLFVKFAYDGINRNIKRSTGYDLSESTYADASSLTNDTLLEQVEPTYDDASNLVQTITRERYHSATGTGSLTSPSGTEPKARVTYAAAWHDGRRRTIATADYGTNGGSALSRPATVPSRSDSVLVTTAEFNSRGEAYKTTDPAATVTYAEFDDAGRRTKLVENYRQTSSSSSSSSGSGCAASDDMNRTTQFTYTAEGTVQTLTAVNATTGNQVTTYTYGTTLVNSAVATSNLLRQVQYPDSAGGSDVVLYAYNRQRQVAKFTDQLGTVHDYNYDGLARQTQDRITTLGTGVDAAVRRIGTTYGVRGLIQKITSYDNAAVGSGSIVNEVQQAYNSFAQLSAEYQSHSGAVNTGSTLKCQYVYADGSANTIRATSMTYPNGRVLNQNYGTAGSLPDAASRIAALIDNDGTTHLADYSYLGLGTVVEVDETQPDLKFTLIGTAGGNDPDTGDIYRGVDRFGRVKDLLWRDYGASQDAARIQHGYDRAGNRLYRADPVAVANSAGFEELYGYDGSYRVKGMNRGTLNAGKTAVTSQKFAQCWTLDTTGNWKGFRQDDNGDGTWDLVQSRTANPVNEITNITNSTGSAWATPAYNAVGNMTTVPKPASPSSSYTAIYDAWNRLVKLQDGANTVQENQYDGLRRRILKKTYSAGVLSETRHLYYSAAWQTLEERTGTSTTADRQFVWGLRYLDDLILRDRDPNADGTLDERLYALQDPNWNVIAFTDVNGDAQERYAYDAYGTPIVLTATFGGRSSSSYAWETAYAGYPWDATTSLYLVRNRVYHPKAGTWAQRDPNQYQDGVNLFTAVRSNPLRFTDPSGLSSFWTRFRGGLKMLGGGAEVAGGVALAGGGAASGVCTAGVSTPVSIPAIAGGVALGTHGADTFYSGMMQMWTGEETRTATSQLLDNITGDPATSETIEMIGSAGGTFKGLAAGASRASGLSNGPPNLYYHTNPGTKAKIDELRKGGNSIFEGLPPGNERTFWSTPAPCPGTLSTGGRMSIEPLNLFRRGQPVVRMKDFSQTVRMTADEAANFRRAWGPSYSWDATHWWKGAAGQYYYRPVTSAWTRTQQGGVFLLKLGGAGATASGIHDYMEGNVPFSNLPNPFSDQPGQ